MVILGTSLQVAHHHMPWQDKECDSLHSCRFVPSMACKGEMHWENTMESYVRNKRMSSGGEAQKISC